MGTARRYPIVEEYTVPLRVLAVACTMRNEALRDVMGAYVTGCCGALRNITEHCGTFGHYGALTERYGTVTENIDFAQY